LRGLPRYNRRVLRTSLLTHADAFLGARAAWQELAGVSENATPFQTWEWQSTWWKHFGGSRSLRLYTVHEGGDLVGIAPMMLSRGIWRALRPCGVGPSDYLHPLARAGYERAVADSLAERFCEEPGVDLIDLHQVRETEAMAERFRARTQEQAKALVLDLPGTFDAYLATLGKSLRYDVRRFEKPGRSETVSIEEPADAVSASAALTVLFDLHVRRWRKRMLPGAFTPALRRFHLEWARLAVEAGMLRLSVLRHRGEPVGAVYGMAQGQTVYYYQAGFDPKAGNISPGTLAVAHTIRRAIEEGMRQFDFMRGDEPYKRRWQPQRCWANERILVPGQGSLGRMASAWNLAGSRVEGRLRQRFEGRGVL